LAPCWSIWLHFDALKPTLRPTTPKQIFLFICFDSFIFWIVFKWISAALCIDLGIVFQPNLYHLSPFVFNFKPATPQLPTPQPHTPTNIKTWPGGMRARALNPPPPLGGRSVPNRNSRTARLQSLSRVRTLCRASPKITPGRPSGLKFRIFQIFGQLFSFPKTV
jgi:hypothetical protein